MQIHVALPQLFVAMLSLSNALVKVLAASMPSEEDFTVSDFSFDNPTEPPPPPRAPGQIDPPQSHKEGPMPIISDSIYSLIILIYVSVIFVFMFFSFCWKQPEPPPPDPAHKNIPMITSILEEMEKKQQLQQMQEINLSAAAVAAVEEEEDPDMQEMQEKPLIDRGTILVSVISEKKSPSRMKQPTIHEEEESAATQV